MTDRVAGGARRTDLEESADPLARLRALSSLAVESGASAVATEASLLAARTEAKLFYVACIGQFKRGKSSLLNAILGEAVLPVGVVPVTSVVTVVRHGMRRSARIRLSSGAWEDIDLGSLSLFVSEEENPKNEKGVLLADVFLPHPLLLSGLCLVDTPGLGSVFEANTAVTRSFIPHIDAALVVLGADPPISGEERAVVETVSATVSRLLFVLNKADRLSDSERREARRFAEKVLAETLRRPIGPILEVSAVESLGAGHATRDLPTVYESLERLAHEAGADIVQEAQLRGLARLGERVLADLEEQRQALRRPLEESERRIEDLRKSVTHAEQAMSDLAHLFAAEQERLSKAFSERKEEFLARTHPEARGELDAFIAASAKRTRDETLSAIRRIAREALERWLPSAEAFAEDAYRKATARFVALANGFLRSLRDSDAYFSSNPPRELEPEAGFRAKRRFYFNDLFELAPEGGLVRLADLAAGRQRRRSGAAEYLKTLLEHNATRIVNDLDERVTESRRILESEIRERLREGLETATRALTQARERQAAGRPAVDSALGRIAELRSRIEALFADSIATS
jgi:GTP-binding protein EngB required for normal cell division